MVDVYVASSKGHEEIIKQSARDFSSGITVPEVTHLKQNFNKLLFNRIHTSESVKQIKSVMIVGAIPKSYFAFNGEYHPFAFLHHELQLIQLLKSVGYYIIYKPRLDTICETRGIFEKYVDRVLTEKFEDVFSYPDCYLFSLPYSTTFGFALLTNKPIVLINCQGYTWYPRALELIKKRCSVVEAESVDGKIVFNKKALLDAIAASVNNIDYSILYEFAF
jgi:hypothetical protein